MSEVKEKDSDDSKIFIYEDSSEPNEDSKSIIYAPYNSYISLDNSFNSNSNKEKYDFDDLEFLNDICEFELQAKKANEIYQKNNNTYFDSEIKREDSDLKEEEKNDNKRESVEKKEEEKDEEEENEEEEEEINYLSFMQNLYYSMQNCYYNYEYFRRLYAYYYYYYYYYYHYY